MVEVTYFPARLIQRIDSHHVYSVWGWYSIPLNSPIITVWQHTRDC